MRQRIMIAIAIACGPTLLLADEPTTALDVTVQAQILDLLGEQRRDRNMSLLLVTHDLGVVAGHTDDIGVMYGGKLVEMAPTRRAVRQHEDALHRGVAAEHPEARRPQPHPAQRDRWPPAGPGQPAGRMPVLAALPVRRGTLPRRGAAADPDRRGSAAHLCVLVSGRVPGVPRDQRAPPSAKPRWRPDGRHRQGAPPRPTATCCCASRTSSSSSRSGAPA